MGVPRHKHLFRRQVARMAPDLRTDELTGAIRYYDCQVDDARLVMTVARTAAAYGAHVASRTKVTGFLRDGDRVVGVRARDLENDVDLEVRARVVINAAGVWTDEIQEMVGGRGALRVEASKGVHLVVPRDRIRSETGFITKTEKSVLFVIPWGRHWIIGTTDTPWNLDLAHPAASRADIDYVLGHVNKLLRTPLDHEDVEGVYAGLRPLARGKYEPTSRISREHTVVAPVPGLVLVAGGKLTTYRVMAQDAVDVAAESLVRGGQPVGASITDRVPLLGAAGFEARTNQRVAIARSSGLPVARIDHLLGQVRRAGRRGPRDHRRRPGAGRAARGHRGLPGRRGGLRGDPRGCPSPRRRADASYPDLDRDLRPRHRVRPSRGDADGRRARLGPSPGRRRGRPLPAPGGGRAAEPGEAHRPGGRRGAGAGARRPLGGLNLRSGSPR